MSEHLLDAPLPRRGRRSGCLVGHAHQELPVISKLLGEEIENRAFGNAGNVVLVVLGVFGGVGAGKHSGKTVPQITAPGQTKKLSAVSYQPSAISRQPAAHL